jgi:hypothetical protein
VGVGKVRPVQAGYLCPAARPVNAEGLDAEQMGLSRVWLDVTTSVHAGRNHDGTTRVERSLVRELPAWLPGRVGFCVYNRTTRRFCAVAPPAMPDAGAGSGRRPGRRRGPIGSAGKAIERRIRRLVKGAVGGIVSSSDRALGRSPFPEAAAGDVLLLAGENWGRHDYSVLRALKREGGVGLAAVLQDMIPHVHPQFFESGSFVDRFEAYVRFLATDTDLVFAISNCTRDDFLKAAPTVDTGKVTVVHLGADLGVPAEPRRPAELSDLGRRPFVLAVSTIQVRKNFDLLYHLWQKFALDGRTDQPHLVIVGRPGFGSGDLLHLMRNDPSITGWVTVLHGAGDVELAWLYANAAFTLYPSWYEGWGLPLSESLAYGKTFIASDRSSLPEAGQGLGIHLSPYDLPAWEREVLRLTRDAAARTAMEERIRAERRLPTWSDCARSMAGALERLAPTT